MSKLKVITKNADKMNEGIVTGFMQTGKMIKCGPSKVKGVKKSRLDVVEECILDLALAVESGRIDRIYQECAKKIFPIKSNKRK